MTESVERKIEEGGMCAIGKDKPRRTFLNDIKDWQGKDCEALFKDH